MPENLRDLIDDSFERYADSTAIRVLRQSEQKGDRGLRYVPMPYRQLGEQRNRLVLGLAGRGLARVNTPLYMPREVFPLVMAQRLRGFGFPDAVPAAKPSSTAKPAGKPSRSAPRCATPVRARLRGALFTPVYSPSHLSFTPAGA